MNISNLSCKTNFETWWHFEKVYLGRAVSDCNPTGHHGQFWNL